MYWPVEALKLLKKLRSAPGIAEFTLEMPRKKSYNMTQIFSRYRIEV